MGGFKKFSVRGCRYLADMDIEGATVLSVEGGNGVGKTLFTKLIMAVFARMHDPGLIAEGRDRLELVMKLGTGMSDPALNGAVIERTITPKNSTAKITLANGNVIKEKIETVLKKIGSVGFALDPLALLTADEKERERYLRTVLPVEFDAAELDRELGTMTGLGGAIDLTVFDQYLSGREGARTEANRRRNDLEGTVNAMSELPALDSEDYVGLAKSLEEALRTAEQAERDDIAAVEAGYRRTVDARKAKLESDIQALRDAAQRDLDNYQLARRESDDEIRMKHAPLLLQVRSDLSVARQKAADQQKAAGAREKVEELRAQLRDAARNATDLQQQVDRLREIRRKKLEQLPIEGVEFRNGRIYVDGKDLDSQLNTSEGMKACIQLGSLAAGDLGLMVTDRFESLDPKNREWAVNAIKEGGYQLVMTRVTDGPFHIERLD